SAPRPWRGWAWLTSSIRKRSTPSGSRSGSAPRWPARRRSRRARWISAGSSARRTRSWRSRRKRGEAPVADGNGSRGSQLRVGYLLKKFPVLSETFILNELLALEAQGVPLHLFALERPNDPRFHDDLPKLKARVAYLPDLRTLWGHHCRVAGAAGKR